jgi:hypothetical protein
MSKRKFETLDVVKLYSTLSVDVWRSVLTKCVNNNDINRLMSIRYGLQAGMSDAAKMGMNSDKLVFWVLKRIRNIETCAKEIIKKKHPMPGDVVISKTHKGKRKDYAMDAVTAKRTRDRELQVFLQRSSF